MKRETLQNNRRGFLIKTGIVAMSGLSVLAASGCGEKEKEEEEVTPSEDLMREHGLLNRVLLVYDHYLQMLATGQQVNPAWLNDSAGIIKTFIEDYHEKQEEDFLFPRFEKAGKLTDLVQVLRTQHQKGRIVTQSILQLAKQPAIETGADKQKLSGLLSSFIRMYRPHEAREDTILFPAILSIMSKHEYDSLGEDMEKNEHKLFGEGGFEQFVDKIAGIEKQLGIYELNQFTPAV